MRLASTERDPDKPFGAPLDPDKPFGAPLGSSAHVASSVAAGSLAMYICKHRHSALSLPKRGWGTSNSSACSGNLPVPASARAAAPATAARKAAVRAATGASVQKASWQINY